MLIRLHINDDNDVQVCTKTIRTWLEANDGQPTSRRPAIANPWAHPHSRQPNAMRRGDPD
jgi:hypothetical protein